MIYASYGYPDGVGAWYMARKLKKPFSITLHRGDLAYWARRPLIREQMIRMIREADSVIIVAEQLKSMLPGGIPHNRVFVVSNGVDRQTFRPMDQMQARRELGLPEGATVFSSVGNSFRRKGCFELMAAFDRLGMKESFLLIVGRDPADGPALDAERKRLPSADRIILTGEIENRLLPTYYAATDVYCLVSHSEGWPCSVMEALSCGKPCIVTPESAGEFITEDLGIVTRYPDLTDAMSQAVQKDWDIEKILAFADDNDWDKVAARTEEILLHVRK